MKKVFGAIWRYLRQTDLVLIAVTLLASAVGFMLVYSATRSSESGARTIVTQVAAILIGITGMIILSKIDYHDMTNYYKFIAAAGVVLLLLPFAFPHQRSGSQDLSWINLHFMTVQPSEVVKIMFVLTFAKHYDLVKENVSSPLNVALLCLHGAVPVGIIVVQSDLGMALVFILIFVSMMFAANIRLRYFVGAAILMLVSAPLLWTKVFKAGSTQRNRILALFDPNHHPKDAFQQLQGMQALGSGQIWGYGLFHGPKTQSAISTGQLPERKNDMIFAVLGEELGFIGCMIVLTIFVVLLVRLIIDSGKSKDALGSMICMGIFSSFAVQMIINLGMVLMLLPVIGISLPFFSSGGSSVVSSYWAVGIALSVYMHRKKSLFVKDDKP